ncbi:MAG: L-threonylcarbamoyladenylate synthase [Verrucomicrobiae bacterium]|nr:L-threonylcarbamoyladenylate synthase [Verrucomicrobiae bacterium]
MVPATPDTISRAAELLRRGGLVAFPTETVYGLGAHALDAAAVRRIFAAKQRPAWDPLIVHVTGIDMAETLAESLPALFYELTAKFWPGPLTLVVRRRPIVPDEVTAGLPTVALRQPRHPVAAALLAAANVPVAAPSANLFGRPSPTRAEHVASDLGDRVDLILDGGPTEVGVESTILDLTQNPPVILRPGGIPAEQLNHAPIAPAVADAHVRAPGMTLRHYSPRTPIELFESEAALQARVRQIPQAGILRPTAETLYEELRRLDQAGVPVILALLPPPGGLGTALRDRLFRAAGQPPRFDQLPPTGLQT